MSASNVCNSLADRNKPPLRADVDDFYVRGYVFNHLKEDVYPNIVAPNKHQICLFKFSEKRDLNFCIFIKNLCMLGFLGIRQTEARLSRQSSLTQDKLSRERGSRGLADVVALSGPQFQVAHVPCVTALPPLL